MSEVKRKGPYPTVVVKGQSFTNVKRVTVPKQSLSLREILKRYIRKEPLPGSNDGVYEERWGDLEKLSKADITVQMEKVEELKGKIKRTRDRELERLNAEKERLRKEVESRALPKEPPTGGGEPPVKSPPLQGS